MCLNREESKIKWRRWWENIRKTGSFICAKQTEHKTNWGGSVHSQTRDGGNMQRQRKGGVNNEDWKRRAVWDDLKEAVWHWHSADPWQTRGRKDKLQDCSAAHPRPCNLAGYDGIVWKTEREKKKQKKISVVASAERCNCNTGFNYRQLPRTILVVLRSRSGRPFHKWRPIFPLLLVILTLWPSYIYMTK